MRSFLWGVAAGTWLNLFARLWLGTTSAQLRGEIYDEAIKAGAAVRVVDQETGEVSVEWRTCDE